MPFSCSEMSQLSPCTWYSRISPLMSEHARARAPGQRALHRTAPRSLVRTRAGPAPRGGQHAQLGVVWNEKTVSSSVSCWMSSASSSFSVLRCRRRLGELRRRPRAHARERGGGGSGGAGIGAAPCAPGAHVVSAAAAAPGSRFCGESVSVGTLASSSRRLFLAWPVDDDESKKCLPRRRPRRAGGSAWP